MGLLGPCETIGAMGLKSHWIVGTVAGLRHRTDMNKHCCPSLFAETKRAARGNWRPKRLAITRPGNRQRFTPLCRPVPITVWQTHSWTKQIVQDPAKIRTLQKSHA